MSSVCVFCGSKEGKNKKYMESAKTLGALIGASGIDLVYGGGHTGLMGAVADACLEEKGKVYGVIPEAIVDLEVGHTGLTELMVVDTMHDRKAKMYDLSDAFVAIAGGMGTLDELCEIVTWSQLKYHAKPIYLVNTEGFFDHLIKHFDLIVEEGFLSSAHRDLIVTVSSMDELMGHLKSEI